jgi:hypothetical protein
VRGAEKITGAGVGGTNMSDLTKYTRSRAARDLEFAEDLEAGYEDFKIGALLR